MDKSALLTVVIPVFNREKLLAECLDSLARQTARGFRLVVVDNASTDGSRAVAETWALKHPDIPTAVVTETSPGACAARNRGLELVETPWTLNFDSDDLMLPGHLQRVLDAIEAHPEADVIGWDTEVQGGPASGRRHVFSAEPRTMWWDLLFAGTMSTQRYCARTGLFRRAGGWNTKVRIWNDIELGSRILALGPTTVALHGESTVLVRHTSESITGDSYSGMIDRMEPALKAMEPTFPQEKGHYFDIKRATMYGYLERERPGEGLALYSQAAGQTQGLRMRLALAVAFYSYRLGLRGGARLVKLIAL